MRDTVEEQDQRKDREGERDRERNWQGEERASQQKVFINNGSALNREQRIPPS